MQPITCMHYSHYVYRPTASKQKGQEAEAANEPEDAFRSLHTCKASNHKGQEADATDEPEGFRPSGIVYIDQKLPTTKWQEADAANELEDDPRGSKT